MTSTGRTWIKFTDRDTPHLQGCMENVLEFSKKFHLYYPTETSGNDGLIRRWVDFGNKTIFPSKVKKLKKTSKLQTIFNEGLQRGKSIKHLNSGKTKFKRRTDLTKYYAHDAHMVDIVIPCYVAKTRYDVKRKKFDINTLIVKGNNIHMRTWWVDGRDFFDPISGKTMLEFLLEEGLFESKSLDYYYEFEINPAGLSPKYNLAIVSFLRILWHNEYYEFIEEVFKLVDSGISEWDAFCMVNSLSKYKYISHFTPFAGMTRMEDVKAALLSGKKSINASFKPHSDVSNDIYSLLYSKDKEEALAYLKGNKAGYINVLCIDNAGAEKTLVKDKIYKGKFTEDKIIIKQDETYSKRSFRSSRFQKS